MTPGTQTSEFWMSLITIVLGLFFVVWGVVKGNSDLLEKGMVMITGATAGYSVSRGIAKITSTGSDGSTPAPTDPTAAANVINKV